MKGNAPYIMPDGKPLSQYLLYDKRDILNGRGGRQHSHRRGKDEVWQQLQSHASGHAHTDYEAAELHVLQVVGNRRRRRWMNEKVLRDMAGPMTAGDMESQFKPVPFGGPARSTLYEAVEQMGQPVWDRLRNISWDKQAAVLQRWEQHVHEAQSLLKSPGPECPAALALQRWARVERKARGALRQANIHSVMELEAMLLEFTSKDDQDESLVLQPPDSFARLLTHGLAAFHGLQSCSLPSSDPHTNKVVVISNKKPTLNSTPNTATESPSDGPQGERAGSSQQGSLAEEETGREGEARRSKSEGVGVLGVSDVEELTCTDVLMAAQELGPCGCLTLQSLERYVRAHLLHGSEDDFGGMARNLVACPA